MTTFTEIPLDLNASLLKEQFGLQPSIDRARGLEELVEEVGRVFPFIVTGGAEIDGIEIGQGDSEKAGWLGCIKGAVVMAAVIFLTEHITKTCRIQKLAFMGPGQGDPPIWPYEQLRELYSICGDVEELIGVRLTESLLMTPSASAAAIFFPTVVDFQGCQLCQNESCSSRIAPFDKRLWESINRT